MNKERFFAIKQEIISLILVIISSVAVAFNIKTFVNAAGLYPGGFSGVALLVQRLFDSFLSLKIPFVAVSYPLNIIALLICYKFVGKRFLIYTCLTVGLSGFLTDLIPSFFMTDDVLLCSVFGGIINGIAVSICMIRGGSMGGLDILANVYGHRFNKDPWNILLTVNCVILAIAGFIFGWDKALYSIIFQYASTQIIQMLYKKYQQATLFIVSDKYTDIYKAILRCTDHSATVLDGTGCFTNEEKKMVYSVVSGQEVKDVLQAIREVDKKAFINIVKTQELDGRFILKEDKRASAEEESTEDTPTNQAGQQEQ